MSSVAVMPYDRIIYPRLTKSNTSQNPPVVGGRPITADLARGLRRIVFGTSVHLSHQDWTKASFLFHSPESSVAYGLQAAKNSTKAVILCVQAYVLKHLLFQTNTSAKTERDLLRPGVSSQREALCWALSDILWRSGSESPFCVVCLPGDNCLLPKDHNYLPDGVTEKLLLFQFLRQDELRVFISKYLHIFEKETGPGVVLLLYSAIITRGLQRILMDVSDSCTQLLTPMGEVTLPLVMLLLTGRATPFLYNGVLYGMGKNQETKPELGTLTRAEVGFLIWRRTDDPPLQVGSRLKTPLFPIWVTCADDQYGVLFSANRELVRDHRAEHRFDLSYYQSTINESSSSTVVEIDTRYNKTSEEQGRPALEKAILSKWQGSNVSWHGASPVL